MNGACRVWLKWLKFLFRCEKAGKLVTIILTRAHSVAMSWTEIIDENSGMPYFYNSTTGETTWVRPTETAVSHRPHALSVDGKRPEYRSTLEHARHTCARTNTHMHTQRHMCYPTRRHPPTHPPQTRTLHPFILPGYLYFNRPSARAAAYCSPCPPPRHIRVCRQQR